MSTLLLSLASSPALVCLLLFGLQDAQDLPGEEEIIPEVLIEDSAGEIERKPIESLEIDDLAQAGAALIRFEGLIPPTERARGGPDRARIDLVGGGRVYAELLDGEDEILNLRLIGGSLLRLSIEEFVGFRLGERFPPAWTEPVVAAREGDRLYRLRGAGVDRIDGTVEAFSARGVRMDTALGSKDFPWEEVAALFIEALDDERQEQQGQAVVVDLIDGSRMPLVFRRLSPDGLDLETRAGSVLRLPLEVVAEVLAVGSGIEFLSDMEPLKAELTSPFGDNLGMVWPVRRDRSTSGAPLRAGGRVWTRGLGVHAPSRVEYALDGSWKSLRGWVAIDDEVIPLPALGSARFRIKSGDDLLWESPVLHGGDAPVEMARIDLKGATRLVLEVDMADEMYVGDRADWLRLILSR